MKRSLLIGLPVMVSVLLGTAGSVMATKVVPAPLCPNVPLEEDIKNSDLLAYVHFVDFTDASRTLGIFEIVYAWKGGKSPGERITYPTTSNFSYAAPESRHLYGNLIFGKRAGPDAYDYAGCRKYLGLNSLSLENELIRQINDVVIKEN